MGHAHHAIGPSLPCAECTPARTLHIPVWFGQRKRPQDIVFRRQGYMERSEDGKGVYWWFEWVPVTPLDGSASSREFVRSTR